MLANNRMLNQLSVDEVERDAREAQENPEKCSITRKLEAEWVGERGRGSIRGIRNFSWGEIKISAPCL